MKETIQHIFSLGIKEIVGLFRDPLLLMLIVWSFSFSIYIAATSNPDAIDHAAIAIVDEDNSALTKRLADSFMPPLFRKPVRLAPTQIDETMDQGIFTFIIVFPPNFQQKVLAGHATEVQVNVDATRMSQAFTGNGYIQNIIMRETNKFILENSPSGVTYTADALIRNRFNPNLIGAWDGALNELVNNIAMLALILTGAALIRERERGTLEHLLVMPVTPLEIMISKVWAISFVVLIASGLSLQFVIRVWLQIPIAGSFLLFMAGLIVNLFAMTSLGIFISCFARDMPQLGLLMILILMPMEILSGGSTPFSSMPEPVQWVMHLAPTTYLVKLFKSILMRGADFTLIWQTFMGELIVGAAYFFIALKRFRQSISS